MSCIYCLNDSHNIIYNREHVIPRLLGTFEQNHTLNNCVCSNCNQFFGDNLEVLFAQGSIEGVRRLQYLRSERDQAVNRLRVGDRIHFKWRSSGLGNGMQLELSYQEGDLSVLPIHQVGFARFDCHGYIYISEVDLTNPDYDLPRQVDVNQDVIIVCNNPESRERLINLLRDRNIVANLQNLENILPNASERIDVDTETKIDEIVFRCIAKIAFNYLARSQGSDFVLRRDFNTIRNYIRYGVQAPYQIIRLSGEPVLETETRNWRQTEGHTVTVGWAIDGVSIVSNIELFNQISYKVSLSRDYRGVWREIRSGHHFDIQSRTIHSLFGVDRRIL
jgi:hypothetical protein